MQRFAWFNSQMQNKCMKRNTWLICITCFSFLSFICLSGCMKDKVTRTYQISTPIYESLTQFREQIKSETARTILSPGKLTRYGHYLFLSDMNTGIHVIDNSNPAAPKNISFINIPGNVDLAIRGNTLYADSYGDLVTMDISNPVSVVARDFKSFVFPDRGMYSVYYPDYLARNSVNPDSINVIIGCMKPTTPPLMMTRDRYITVGGVRIVELHLRRLQTVHLWGHKTVGTNGSMARFTIINDYYVYGGLVKLDQY